MLRTLSVAELLSVWENGVEQSPVHRALSLLGASYPEVPLEELAQLQIGFRDARLLELREQIFGTQLGSLATCPACGEQLEFSINARDIRAMPAAECAEPLLLVSGDYKVEFRLPNSLDLLSLDPAVDVETNRAELFERCVTKAHRCGAEIVADDLPADIAAAVAGHMAEADPQADVQVEVTCPVCRQAWQASFDIVSFLWSEIHAWANRILGEVHTLASAYGWRETDILGLSPQRRRIYLEMIDR